MNIKDGENNCDDHIDAECAKFLELIDEDRSNY